MQQQFTERSFCSFPFPIKIFTTSIGDHSSKNLNWTFFDSSATYSAQKLNLKTEYIKVYNLHDSTQK